MSERQLNPKFTQFIYLDQVSRRGRGATALALGATALLALRRASATSSD